MGQMNEGEATGARDSFLLANLSGASDVCGAHNKRQRNCAGSPSAAHHNYLKSTAEVMAGWGWQRIW